jgi:hypothetical protein
LFCELSDLISPGIHPETRIFILFFGHENFSRCKHFCDFFQRAMDSIVPNCPAGLCITKQDFLKPDFSVDNFFIEQSVRDTPLDTLRYGGLPHFMFSSILNDVFGSFTASSVAGSYS